MQDPQKLPKSCDLGTIAQLCRAISSQLRHVSTIGKKFVKHHYLPHMSSQYGELWPTSGWDPLASLGHPRQLVSRLGSVTARHSSSGRQPNFAALNRGRHLHSAGRHGSGERKSRALQQLDCVARTMHVHQCTVFLKEKNVICDVFDSV